jgi:type VI secretion system secreted protein VgrG
VSTSTFALRLESNAKVLSNAPVLVRRVEGHESISALPRYVVDVVVPDAPELAARDLLAEPVTLVFDALGGAGQTRRLHLHVAEVTENLEGYRGLRALRLLLTHRLAGLLAVEQSETFVDRSVLDLIHQKLDPIGFDEQSMVLRLHGEHPKREFVVQYAESDLAFLSRLCEHEGISYYFEHDERVSRVVFCDAASGFGRVPGPPLRLRSRLDDTESLLLSLSVNERLVGKHYSVHDHDERNPLVDLAAGQEMADGFAGGVIEYGTNHKSQAEGAWLVKVRAEEFHCRGSIYEGRSQSSALGAGLRFEVEGMPARENLAVNVIELHFVATQPVTADDDVRLHYENTFKAIPADRTFRPKRTTPKPRLHGIVTGIVDAGPGVPMGPYAVLDAEGRYQVRFHFDVQHPGDRPSSLPVRMMQNHAGTGYGTHFPLKPGAEVAVGFIGGDPDRPVILGALPNGVARSPVSLLNPGVHRIETSMGVRLDLVE